MNFQLKLPAFSLPDHGRSSRDLRNLPYEEILLDIVMEPGEERARLFRRIAREYLPVSEMNS